MPELTNEVAEILKHRFAMELKFMDKAIELEKEENVEYDSSSDIAAMNMASHMIEGICENFIGKDQSVAYTPVEMVKCILEGLPISPLLGTEDEWAGEIDQSLINGVVGQDIWFTTERLEGTNIHVDNIQYNIRYPYVKRFNHDNETAHRVDAVDYIDHTTGKKLSMQEAGATSIRFIQFPYNVKPTVKFVVDVETSTIINEIGDTSKESMGSPFPEFILKLIETDKDLHPEDYELEDDEDDEEDEDVLPETGDGEDNDITDDEKEAIKAALGNLIKE